jgi:hypothetical protein
MRIWHRVAIVILVCVPLSAQGFLEERVYCAIEGVQVRISLGNQGILCVDYKQSLNDASDLLDSRIRDTRELMYSATTIEDQEYRRDLQEVYRQDQNRLHRMDIRIRQAIANYESTVLRRLQEYVEPTLAVADLRCQNVWPTFRIRYTTSRFPLCRQGQSRQINTMRTTTDLDEFIETLIRYADKRTRIGQ